MLSRWPEKPGYPSKFKSLKVPEPLKARTSLLTTPFEGWRGYKSLPDYPLLPIKTSHLRRRSEARWPCEAGVISTSGRNVVLTVAVEQLLSLGQAGKGPDIATAL